MEKVLVVGRLVVDGRVIGLRYKFCKGTDTLYDIRKEDLARFFAEYDVTNVRLHNDWKIQSIDGSPIPEIPFKQVKGAPVVTKTYLPRDCGMSYPNEGIVTVYHGSASRVKVPYYGYRNSGNDFGKGFYLTLDSCLAEEWALSKKGYKSYVYKYTLNLQGLRVLRLDSSSPEDILAWICLVAENKDLGYFGPLLQKNLMVLQSIYGVKDWKDYDVIVGYRADDSFFSCIKSFLEYEMSLEKLTKAIKKGCFATQIVLKSKKAFEVISHVDHERILSDSLMERFLYRELSVRNYVTRAEDKGTTFFMSLVQAGGSL